MKPSRRRGATLGVVAACLLTLIFIGFAIYFLAKVLGGGKQVANATDAGAISAAKSLSSITADISTISNWAGGGTSPPAELSGLAVNTTGSNIGAIDSTYGTGPNSTLYNIFAYNRAAGAALMVALNANYENTATAQSNAANTIQNLALIGNAIYGQLLASSQLNGGTNEDTAGTVAYAFQNTSDYNTSQMDGNQWVTGADGRKHTTTLTNDLSIGYVGGTAAGGQVGKGNVYFAQATQDGNWAGLSNYLSSSGVTATDSAGNTCYFVNGYSKDSVPLALSTNTVYPIYFVSANPTQFPHLVDLGRFNSETADPSSSSPITVNGTTMHLPFNAVSGQTKATQVTASGNLLSDQSSALLTGAIASAVLGSSTNTYPIQMPGGYIRLRNYYDAVYANTSSSAEYPDASPVSGMNTMPTPPDAGNSIFNNELYVGSGGYNGINSYASASAPAESSGGTYVFGTETPEFVAPTYTYNNEQQESVMAQLSDWAAYANSGSNANIAADNAAQAAYTSAYNAWVSGGQVGPAPVGPPQNQYTDAKGKDGTLDPTYGAYGNGGTPVPGASSSALNPASPGGAWTYNHYQNNAWAPNLNAQVAGGTASGQNMFDAANSSEIQCNDHLYNGSENPVCDSSVAQWQVNYGRSVGSPSGTLDGSGSPPIGGLTDLEYIKGEVMVAYQYMDNNGGYNGGFKAQIGGTPTSGYYYQPSPNHASGTRKYDRSGYYAADYNTTVNFGSNQTPAGYIQWFSQNGFAGTGNPSTLSSCSAGLPQGNGMDLTNSNLWNSAPSAVQYQLLKRCQQIDPTATAATLYTGTGSGLLEKNTLDLGQTIYLYLNPATGKLDVTGTAGNPTWATQLPDGYDATSPKTCYDNPWDPSTNGWNIIDTTNLNPLAPLGAKGDLDLHEQPFTQPQINGSLQTYDGVQWTLSSGGNGGLLGEMLFQNVTTATGTSQPITFSGPN
jgi:hypothetical protein